MASGRGSGPLVWQLIAPPPAPPVAEIRMINADYQAGGEHELRVRERAHGEAPAWANGKVNFPNGMATLGGRADGELTRAFPWPALKT